MKILTNSSPVVPAIITGNSNVNNLGVVRTLGRHGIPTILLSSNRQDIVRYSRYIGQKLACPGPKESEIEFVNFLLNQGRQNDEKYVIFPTSDDTVMALARYREELDRYYILPVPDFELVDKLVDKKKFYQSLDKMSIPHPKTYYPADISELKTIGLDVEYPYIIKPAHMHLFMAEFDTKCFVINSPDDLINALHRLENKDLQVLVQEIIPGKELYSLSMYLNRESVPLALCGYDKLRQEPPDFGLGTLWQSTWRVDPSDLAVQTLQAMNYRGIAESEFKKDPRDGRYKFLEVNARMTRLNSLMAKCGVDIVHVAYLDTIGKYSGNSISQQHGILWIDEINEVRACLKRISRETLGFKNITRYITYKKVFATAAWDDPVPFFVSLFNLTIFYLKRLFAVIRRPGRH